MEPCLSGECRLANTHSVIFLQNLRYKWHGLFMRWISFLSPSVRENVCSNSKKRKKSCFFDFGKKRKNVLKNTYVCSFKNYLITPVVNSHYTVIESQWAKNVNSFWRSGTKLLLTTFTTFWCTISNNVKSHFLEIWKIRKIRFSYTAVIQPTVSKQTLDCIQCLISSFLHLPCTSFMIKGVAPSTQPHRCNYRY